MLIEQFSVFLWLTAVVVLCLPALG